MTQTESHSERLFFALWPEPAVRERVAGLLPAAVADGGKPVAESNLHLTLVFLGSVTAEQRPCIEAAADRVKQPPFELVLDRLGYFPRPRVVWVGCRDTPEPAVALARDLNVQLGPCGWTPERRPFRAHLTLARKVRRFRGKGPLDDPVVWSVTEFCLVRSRLRPEGVRYEVQRCWALTG